MKEGASVWVSKSALLIYMWQERGYKKATRDKQTMDSDVIHRNYSGRAGMRLKDTRRPFPEEPSCGSQHPPTGGRTGDHWAKP